MDDTDYSHYYNATNVNNVKKLYQIILHLHPSDDAKYSES